MPRPFLRGRKKGTGTDGGPPPPPPGDTTLRIGLMGMHNHVGEGPGGNTAEPIYRAVQWNPHSEGLVDVPGVIALAIQKNIWLIAYAPGSATAYGANTATGFNMAQYESQLDKLVAIPSFNAAVYSLANPDGIIHIYMGDEPYHPKWENSSGQNTWTPTIFNQAARKCKDRWPGCLNYGRVDPVRLRDGWGGNNPPVGGYDAIDYGWLQYERPNIIRVETFSEALGIQKAAAAAVDIGVAVSINLVNGGLLTSSMDGINPCWDYLNNGSSSGRVVGQPGSGPYAEGQQVPCASWNPGPTSNQVGCLPGPNWLQKYFEVMAADDTIPFALAWSYPSASAGSDSVAPYINRSDWAAKFDYGIQLGLGRTDFIGLRTPKP